MSSQPVAVTTSHDGGPVTLDEPSCDSGNNGTEQQQQDAGGCGTEQTDDQYYNNEDNGDEGYHESQQQQNEDESQGWTTVGNNRPQASPRRVGMCTSFNAKKGWGWVRDIYTDDVYMVHHSEIRPRLEPRLGPSYFTPCLWTGEYVEFSVGMNPRKQQECAKAVTGINGGTLIMDWSVALVTEYRGADGNPVRRQLPQMNKSSASASASASSSSSGRRTSNHSSADHSDADYSSDADQYERRPPMQQRTTAPYQRQNNSTRHQQQQNVSSSSSSAPLQARRR